MNGVTLTFEEQQTEAKAAAAAGALKREQNQSTQRTIQIFTIAFAAVTAAVMAPALAAAIAALPAALVPIVSGLVPVLWSAVRASIMSQDVAAAILTSGIEQTDKVVSTYSSPAFLQRIGVAIPTGLTEQAKQSFAIDYARRFADRSITQALPNAIRAMTDPTTALGGAVQEARAIAVRQSLDPDAALGTVGLTPEQIAQKNPSLRQDVAAMALNAGLDKYVYDIDWFDPATGQFKSKLELSRIRQGLRNLKGAGVAEKLAALDSRITYHQVPDRGGFPITSSPFGGGSAGGGGWGMVLFLAAPAAAALLYPHAKRWLGRRGRKGR